MCDLLQLKTYLPVLISRKDIGKYLGGVISPKTLANLDSLNEGPPRIKIGRTVAYPTETLLIWLHDRVEKTTGGRK